MNKDLTNAIDNVQIVYEDIIDIANESIKELTGDLDTYLDRVYNNVEHLSNDDISIYINSPGGSVYDCLGLYDLIQNLKNKGIIMKAVMGELKGKADGKLINQIVSELCK